MTDSLKLEDGKVANAVSAGLLTILLQEPFPAITDLLELCRVMPRSPKDWNASIAALRLNGDDRRSRRGQRIADGGADGLMGQVRQKVAVRTRSEVAKISAREVYAGERPGYHYDDFFLLFDQKAEGCVAEPCC